MPEKKSVTKNQDASDGSLLTLRTALVLLAAVGAAGVAGILGYESTTPHLITVALFVASAAFVGAVKFFDWLIS